MHMVCLNFRPITASTELTEFLYISYRKKITTPPFGARVCWRPGICPLPLPAALASGDSDRDL